MQGQQLNVPSAISGCKELSSILQAADMEALHASRTQHLLTTGSSRGHPLFDSVGIGLEEAPMVFLQPQEEDEMLPAEGFDDEEDLLLHQMRPLVAAKGNEGRASGGSSSGSSDSGTGRGAASTDGSAELQQVASSRDSKQASDTDQAADGSTGGGGLADTNTQMHSTGGKPVPAKELSAAARSGFILAALSAAALLPPDVLQPSVQEELRLLQAAAQAGSVEAQLALADRWLIGRTLPKSCQMGVQYLHAAAASVAQRVEEVSWGVCCISCMCCRPLGCVWCMVTG